jgi:prepilin-type N-terminal cleavage/methylation domain-containing protein
MSSILAIRRRSRGAFTLVEMLVTLSMFGVLGGIVYGIATEALVAFARNTSINKSYTDARLSIDRLAQLIQSAGHPPSLVDVSGTPLTTNTNGPAPGVRFYRGSSAPLYTVAGGASLVLTSTTVSLTIASGQSPPQTGDLFLAGGIGFQAVGSVTTSGTTATVTFPAAISTYCQTTPSTTGVAACKSLLAFTRVAYVAVGTELRYYPIARSVSVDTAAVFNNRANYQVVANLPATPGATTQTTPFSLSTSPGMTSLLIVALCAEAPDYNNRNSVSGTQTANSGSYNKLGAASTYCQINTSLGSRIPTLIRAPYPN